MTEQVEVRALEPMTSNRWIIVIDGFENFPFIIRSADLPVFETGVVSNFMYLELYNAVDIPSNSMLKQWIDQCDEKRLTLKLLDKSGTVVESWKMDAILRTLSFGKLEYDASMPWITRIKLEVNNVKIN